MVDSLSLAQVSISRLAKDSNASLFIWCLCRWAFSALDNSTKNKRTRNSICKWIASISCWWPIDDTGKKIKFKRKTISHELISIMKSHFSINPKFFCWFYFEKNKIGWFQILNERWLCDLIEEEFLSSIRKIVSLSFKAKQFYFDLMPTNNSNWTVCHNSTQQSYKIDIVIVNLC